MKKLILIMFVFLIVSCSDETKREKEAIDSMAKECKQIDHKSGDCDKSGKYDKTWRKGRLKFLREMTEVLKNQK